MVYVDRNAVTFAPYMNLLRILAESGIEIKYNPVFSIDRNVSVDKPI